MGDLLTVICGDALEKLRELPDESVQCCVTSPPYWGLRDYGTARWEGGDPTCEHQGKRCVQSGAGATGDKQRTNAGSINLYAGDCGKCGAVRIDNQIGLETAPENYVNRLAATFSELRRVLAADGTLWLNLGDSYNAYNGGAGPSSSLSQGAQTHERPQLETGYGLRNKSVKPKDLIGIPWMVAFALRADGWYLRSDIIWSKPNPMPESVTDRPTKAHEYLFLLSKSRKYFYDYQAILEPAAYDGRTDTVMKGSEKYADGYSPNSNQTKDVVGHERWPNRLPDSYKGSLPGRSDGPGQDRRSTNDRVPKRSGNKERKPASARGVPVEGNLNGTNGAVAGSVPWEGFARNKRTVWTVTTQPYAEAHFATYPPDLIKPCILAGCPVAGTVLDPFAGSGTTGMVAIELGRKAILIELNPEYVKLIHQRCNVTPGLALA